MKAFPIRILALIGCAVILAGIAPARAEMTILVVDQQEILRNSLAGQDLSRQAAALRDQIGQEIEAEQKSIISAEKSLEADAKVLSQSQREQRASQLMERRRNYQIFEQRKSQVLQLSVARATNEIMATLKPIYEGLITERKADLVIEHGAVMFVAPEYNITKEATKRLDEKLKSVKLERVNLDAQTNSKPEAEGGTKNN